MHERLGPGILVSGPSRKHVPHKLEQCSLMSTSPCQSGIMLVAVLIAEVLLSQC